MRKWSIGTSVASIATVLAVATALAAPMPFAAHRAAYELKLGRGTGMKAPAGIDGVILYRFGGSSCAGFATSFRQITHFERSEGSGRTNDERVTTLEEPAKGALKFESRTAGAGGPDRVVSGVAVKGAAGALDVKLDKPAPGDSSLSGPFEFPTEQMQALIDAAQAGLTTYSARLYDGSDDGRKPFDTFAVIGARKIGGAVDPAERVAPLDSTPRWPITMSYFAAGGGKDAPPDFTMSYDLYENGVTGSLVIDYGDFTIEGRMVRFEPLAPAKPCR